MTDLEKNKESVVAYYTTAFGGEPEQAVARYLGDHYIQHNPEAGDGPDAFIGFVRALREANPELRLEIKRVIAEGETVREHQRDVLRLCPAAGYIVRAAHRTSRNPRMEDLWIGTLDMDRPPQRIHARTVPATR